MSFADFVPIEKEETIPNYLYYPPLRNYKLQPFNTDMTEVSARETFQFLKCFKTSKKIKIKKTLDEKILDSLSKLISKLKNAKDYKLKMEILIELDDFLRLNEDLIKNKYPEKLVSILNSL